MIFKINMKLRRMVRYCSIMFLLTVVRFDNANCHSDKNVRSAGISNTKNEKTQSNKPSPKEELQRSNFHNKGLGMGFVKTFQIVKLKISDRSNRKILKFNAFGINFHVRLSKESSPKVISPNMAIHFGNKVWSSKHFLQLSQLYKGYVVNVEESFAYGTIDGYTFDGYIRLLHETFYIEPFHKYFKKQQNTSNKSSVVYKRSDLLANQHKNSTRVSLNAVDTMLAGIPFSNIKYNGKRVNTRDSRSGNAVIFGRTKRSLQTTSRSCHIHVVADHTFYNTIGKGSVVMTISKIVYLVNNADRIFRGTDFDGDIFGDNIGFTIKNITIFADAADNNYKMNSEGLSVYDYLDIFSQYDFDEYCLGVAFTNRDFIDGVVGLAWVGSSTIYGTSGGICQSRIRLLSDGNLYSFNTALITLVNNGQQIPTYRASLTLAHEFGHSFGSPHDDIGDQQCHPDNEFGNYLMFPYTTDGSKPNHDKFSMCSVNSMYPVIVNKGGCFLLETDPVCGNSIVEDDEECDCGNTQFCDLHNDQCCTPSDSSTGTGCRFNRDIGKMCSPLLSPCCNKSCQFIPESLGILCATSTPCRSAAYCNGIYADCPVGVDEPNGTICDGGRKACMDGHCMDHICTSVELEVCHCNVDPFRCMVCCRPPNSTICSPARDFGIYSSSGADLFVEDGSPCDEYTGFCDTSGVCVKRDSESTINRLGEMFDGENMKNIATWFKNYWYYLVLVVIVMALLVFIFIITKRQIDNNHMDAYRMGKLLRVIYEADQEKLRHLKNLSETSKKIDEKIRKIQLGIGEKEFTNAIATLQQLFPTAPLPVLTSVAKQSSCEDVAVRLLLMKRYPIRPVVLPSLRE